MQAVAVFIAVGGALIYLGCKAYNAFRKSTETCEGCAFSKSPELKEK